jgi:hypothetical protein
MINQFADALNELVGYSFVDDNLRKATNVVGLIIFCGIAYQATSPQQFAYKILQPLLLNILSEKICYLTPSFAIPFKNYLPSMRWFVSLGVQISMDFLSGEDWYFSMSYISGSALKALLKVALNDFNAFHYVQQQYPKTTMLTEKYVGYFIDYLTAAALNKTLVSRLKNSPVLTADENAEYSNTLVIKPSQVRQTFFNQKKCHSDSVVFEAYEEEQSVADHAKSLYRCNV